MPLVNISIESNLLNFPNLTAGKTKVVILRYWGHSSVVHTMQGHEEAIRTRAVKTALILPPVAVGPCKTTCWTHTM